MTARSGGPAVARGAVVHSRESAHGRRTRSCAVDIAVFDTHAYDRVALEAAKARTGHRLVFFEPRLTAATAPLARGFRAVCSFVNDRLDRVALEALRAG